jgi:phage gp36-like protein
MALSIIYCSETELDQILSSFGVEVRTDDTDTGTTNETIISAVLEQASAEINYYLFDQYPLSIIAPGGTALIWVKWACAYIGSFLLCQRRGNPVPDPLAEKYQKTIEALQLIESGKKQLPGDSGLVSPQFDYTPAISNYVYSEWFPRTHIRRVPSTSTGGPQTPGRKQHNAPDFWLFPWF